MVNYPRLKRFLESRGWALGLLLAGLFVYLGQAVFFAITQKSMIDEGLFLFKGCLFASGAYRPYQDYGPWMQKAPFAYLIPGTIQLWFGQGLLVGRIYALLTSLLIVIGLWLVARRLAGRWWGLAGVWMLAINPAAIKFYSVAASEGLVACLLVWTFFLVLGEKRPVWQLVLGSLLASILVLTRQNMLPLLPLLLLFILWQYGRRPFLWALGSSAAVFLVVHGLYWPGILRLWSPWLPASLTPFLDPWRAPQGASAWWVVKPKISSQLVSFFMGFRFHFLALMSGLAALLFWPPRSSWKSQGHYRSAVFLAVLFVVLFGLHAFAGTGHTAANNYNAYTFTPYLSFFAFIGILLLVVAAQAWAPVVKPWRQSIAVLMVLVISTGIGYSNHLDHGDELIALKLPRMQNFFRTFRFLPGTAGLGAVLENKFGLNFATSRWLVPSLIGLGVGLAIVAVGVGVWLIDKGRGRLPLRSLGAIVLASFLVIGALLSPTVVLGADFTNYDCGTNVIQQFEQAGMGLSRLVPAGSTVYWDGGNAIAVLLYLPGIRVFPQQLDGKWNYWTGGDDERLARYGYWNDSLKRQWQQDADFFIIQAEKFTPEWQDFLDPGRYVELKLDQVLLGCNNDTYLRLFQKLGTPAVSVLPAGQ